MRRSGISACAAVVLVGAGCLLPGLGDFSGDPIDAAAIDANPDGGAESAATDAKVGSFCQRLSPPPTFCADFDLGDFPAGFDSLTSYGAGTSVLDDGALGDPARSFYASTGALTGSTQAAGALQKKLAAPVKSSLRIEFDYVPVALDSSERSVVGVTFGKDVINLFVKSSGARLAEAAALADGGTVYGGGNLAKGFTVGKKTHVKWVITVGGGKSSSSITLDTDAVEFDPLHVQDYPSAPQISLGMIFVVAPSPGWGARIDDVVYDLQ